MRNIFLLLSLFVFSGCTTLYVFQPTNLNEIPEVSDGSDAVSGFEFGSTTGYEYTSTSDASIRPPTFSPSVVKKAAASGQVRLPFKNAPVEVALGGYWSGVSAMFKYQFLGPRFPDAKQGDFSLAAATKVTLSSSMKTSGNQNGLFGASGYPWSATMNSSGIAGTVLAGYRAGDTVLLYTGALMSDSSVKANINQDLSADTLDAGGTYTYTDRVRRSGPVLGFLVSVNKRFSLQVEGTYLRSTFDQANVVLDNETSAAATARFDLGSSTKN